MTPKAKAQGLIHIFLPGGIAHQDTFDPKPFAPLEYRGDLGVVKTKLEGAKKHQEASTYTMCFMLLVVMVAGCLLAVMVKLFL